MKGKQNEAVYVVSVSLRRYLLVGYSRNGLIYKRVDEVYSILLAFRGSFLITVYPAQRLHSRSPPILLRIQQWIFGGTTQYANLIVVTSRAGRT